ncbi:hypothetical protein [Allorhizocola rhizosphaerae]|uniref:hypothetical protein n=1 Tax=Allorhizocola rhizosphaerae TaxID=1872709 RepID=UPI0013C2C850|nr:hypothetical protein [Allorhizocola rhizosphaerae]
MESGLDKNRLSDKAYIEALSKTSEKVSAVKAKLLAGRADLPDAVDFGVVPGSDQMIVYWSGSTDAPALQQIRQLANAYGLGLLVAARKVSKAQLTSATDYLEANASRYLRKGIALSAYGGFSADFDGVQVYVDKDKSQLKDIGAIKETLEAELGIPVNAEFGAGQTYVGKYDDTSPYNGGGIMVGTNSFCTTGFGVIYGASVYRYISARHCDDGPYYTLSGRPMGNRGLVGTGYNGAAVYTAAGSDMIFAGSNVGNPTNVRYLTQRDPGLSTVGVVVCQEGANMGQRCGTIRQVALNFNDGYGTIRVNYVRSTGGTIIAAQGDSGASVITLHTQDRAWAVGILQGGIRNEYNRTGSACGARYWNASLVCSDNFVFTNVDYALSGFAGYGINYY